MSPPIRVSANSRLAKEAVAQLRGGKDARGQKAFDLVAGVAAPKTDAAKGEGRKPGKYLNIGTRTPDGYFPSLTELRRWEALKLAQRAGLIRNLSRQKSYELVVDGVFVGKYVSDHEYEEMRPDGSWLAVVEDVKGKTTAKLRTYLLKKGLMKALYNIEIREV